MDGFRFPGRSGERLGSWPVSCFGKRRGRLCWREERLLRFCSCVSSSFGLSERSDFFFELDGRHAGFGLEHFAESGLVGVIEHFCHFLDVLVFGKEQVLGLFDDHDVHPLVGRHPGDWFENRGQ